eukprot:2374405-Amphidinium_carterae.1
MQGIEMDLCPAPSGHCITPVNDVPTGQTPGINDYSILFWANESRIAPQRKLQQEVLGNLLKNHITT